MSTKMLPIEIIDNITDLAGVPRIKDLGTFGVDAPKMCGTFNADFLQYKRAAPGMLTWRVMRQAAGLPHNKQQLKQHTGIGKPIDSRLARIILHGYHDPLYEESQNRFQVREAVKPFYDNEGRICIYCSLYLPSEGLKTWLELYGLWCRVECYTNTIHEPIGPKNWPCRNMVYILRLDCPPAPARKPKVEVWPDFIFLSV